jgi:hypothetical protein
MKPAPSTLLFLALLPIAGAFCSIACSGGDSNGDDSTAGEAGGSGSSSLGGAGSTAGAAGISSAGATATGSCTEGESNCFSFFVTSRARLFAVAEAFNGSTSGWGGDLRYGTGDGLTGADKICTEIAESSVPGNGKTWVAFLSTSAVDAIDRVGSGPWYDRLNRPIANNVTELVDVRPGGITNSTIRNNLPNEDGTPHHTEEPGCTNLSDCADNHDVLTGSDSDGRLCTADSCAGGMGGPGGGHGGGNITDYTCQDWTLGSSVAGIAPRVGHTWPTGMGGGGEDDWISRLTESGCAVGYNLVDMGGPSGDGLGSVGDGGGYGAIYCLATSPY